MIKLRYFISCALQIRVFNDGSLYLTNVQLQHAGNYTCHALRNQDVVQTHLLTVYSKFYQIENDDVTYIRAVIGIFLFILLYFTLLYKLFHNFLMRLFLLSADTTIIYTFFSIVKRKKKLVITH